jgi:spore coat polysaccharide biosynthesis predicted glycosyltransferase SpsG
MDTIFILTKGDEESGMGHLYRMATLLSHLAPQANCYVYAIVPTTIETPLPNDTESKFEQVDNLVDVAVDVTPDTLIVDLPENQDDEILSTLVSDIGSDHVVAFGSWDKWSHPEFTSQVDTFVDFSTHPPTFESSRRRSDGITYLLGPRYMLLRKEFNEWKDAWTAKPKLENIIGLFGGSDPQNHTLTATQNLLSNSTCRVTAILGPGNTFRGEFQDRFDDESRVSIVIDPDSLPKHLSNGDLLVTSPGLTMYEALYVGLPVVAFYQNELQQQVYNECRFVYPVTKLDDISSLVKQAYDRRRNHEQAIEIGTGLSEILNEILKD